MKLEKAVAIAFYLQKVKTTTAKKLAEKYEVSEREVYRAIDRLSTFLPIYTKPGLNGGIFWQDIRSGKA